MFVGEVRYQTLAQALSGKSNVIRTMVPVENVNALLFTEVCQRQAGQTLSPTPE